jgi:hypothetical protein
VGALRKLADLLAAAEAIQAMQQGMAAGSDLPG